ncbi:MAG: diguanylate cyclase [Nitrospiraceae bacterium]|nr:MAG: diguanylate cyclase [Nitrospiraceae bacterium]
MIPVFVEAVKNIKNAVALMPDILLIDKDASLISLFRKSLSKQKYTFSSVSTISAAVAYLRKNRVDVIAITIAFTKKAIDSAGFTKLSGDIPKIYILNGEKRENRTPWLDDAHSLPLYKPLGAAHIRKAVKRLLSSRERQAELNAYRKELDFLSCSADICTTDQGPVEIISAIMNRAKTCSQTRAWSLLIHDSSAFKKIHFGRSRSIHKCILARNTGIAGRVFYRGRAISVENAYEDHRFDTTIDHYLNLKIKSLLCVPLRIRGKSVGVLRFMNKSSGNSFTAADLNILEHAARHVAIVLDRALQYQRIEKIRITDELTDVFNIRYLNQAIDMEVERTRRYGSMFSLIFMDLDNFKIVNDRFGHLAGSKVLIEVAAVLKRNLRKLDIITRYGGDEYVIIMPQTARQSCMFVAERLRREIEKEDFLKSEGLAIKITASFGVASYPDNARNKEELLKIADKAMYHGKFLTKNIVFEAK